MNELCRRKGALLQRHFSSHSAESCRLQNRSATRARNSGRSQKRKVADSQLNSNIRSRSNKVVRMVELAAVDRVAWNSDTDWDQPRQIGESVVASAVHSEFVISDIELPKAIQLVLLAVLESLQEAVAERHLGREPCICGWIVRTPPSGNIGIAIIACYLQERYETRYRDVGRGQIDCIISLANVECPTVNRNSLDR